MTSLCTACVCCSPVIIKEEASLERDGLHIIQLREEGGRRSVSEDKATMTSPYREIQLVQTPPEKTRL